MYTYIHIVSRTCAPRHGMLRARRLATTPPPEPRPPRYLIYMYIHIYVYIDI